VSIVVSVNRVAISNVGQSAGVEFLSMIICMICWRLRWYCQHTTLHTEQTRQ